MKNPRVLICNTDQRNIRKIMNLSGNSSFSWVYLGENVSTVIEIENKIDTKGNRVEIGERLQKTAQELRTKYIDYIGCLDVENNSLNWWARALPEKNPDSSKTFLHICYIKICFDLLDSNSTGRKYVFFVENNSLRRSLLKNLSCSYDHEIIALGGVLQDKTDFVRRGVKALSSKTWFIIESLFRIVITKYFYFSRRLIIPFKEDILISTFVDDRSFSEDHAFVDSYLGDLSQCLKKRGQDVAFVPFVLNPKSPYFLNIHYYYTILKKMEKCNEKFLLPYGFLPIKDVVMIALKTLLVPKRQPFKEFYGYNISDLIYEDFLNEWSGITLPRDLLLNKVVKEWKNNSIRFDRFIYPFENQSWEKVYCLSLNQFYPGVIKVGYQHSSVSKFLLNYFCSSKELDIVPLPERIITNGGYAEKLLRESGYNPQILRKGGAIRYANLLKARKIKKKYSNQGKKTVLVAISISRTEAVELFWKIKKAFADSAKYEVIIKCHPILPYNKFSNDRIETTPKNFRLSNELLSELLSFSDILVYTSSASCLEALIMNIPLIHVESDFIIDIDPLDFAPETTISVRTPEEIRQAVNRVLEDHRKFKYIGGKNREIIQEVFGEVGQETYDLFLQ